MSAKTLLSSGSVGRPHRLPRQDLFRAPRNLHLHSLHRATTFTKHPSKIFLLFNPMSTLFVSFTTQGKSSTTTRTSGPLPTLISPILKQSNAFTVNSLLLLLLLGTVMFRSHPPSLLPTRKENCVSDAGLKITRVHPRRDVNPLSRQAGRSHQVLVRRVVVANMVCVYRRGCTP